jgi:hypothetical protein
MATAFISLKPSPNKAYSPNASFLKKATGLERRGYMERVNGYFYAFYNMSRQQVLWG